MERHNLQLKAKRIKQDTDSRMTVFMVVYEYAQSAHM